MRDWLVQHNLLKSDAQASQDEVSFSFSFSLTLLADALYEQITNSFASNYGKLASKTSAYLGWSDERIRGWLREHNIPVAASSSRSSLLESMRQNCMFPCIRTAWKNALIISPLRRLDSRWTFVWYSRLGY